MDAQKPPIVNLAGLALEHWTQGTLYESRDASFGARLGLKDLGIGYGEVPPGKSGCPFHSHHVEDELFVILEGHGTYRYGRRRSANTRIRENSSPRRALPPADGASSAPSAARAGPSTTGKASPAPEAAQAASDTRLRPLRLDM